MTTRVDAVVLHPVAGLAILALILFVMFQAVFSWAQPLMELLSSSFSALGELVHNYLPDGLLQSFVQNGLISGVGSVIVFLPQIIIIFLFILLLEDFGYMARAAFLMDRIMGGAGLHGRAFIPLLSSFACAIPGIMATRVIDNRRDRLTTILIAPLFRRTDIGYFKDFRDGRDGLAYEAFVERVIDTIERITMPTIAVIDGWAVGGGLALATACDFSRLHRRFALRRADCEALSNTLSSRNIARLQAAFGTPAREEDADARRLSERRRSARVRIRARNLRARRIAGSGALARATFDCAFARHAARGERKLAPHRDRSALDDEDLIESVYGSRFRGSGRGVRVEVLTA